MAGVIDGQSVDATVTNAAFIPANGDGGTIGVLALNNAAASSGPVIGNTQQAINVLIAGVGGNSTTAATGYTGVPSNTLTSGNSHLQSLIDLANKFENATGHKHDGTQGGGAPVPYVALTGTQLAGYAVNAIPLTAVSGTSSDITTDLSGQPNSYDSLTVGVVTNPPFNYVQVFSASGDSYIDNLGNKVYARITAAPSADAAPSAWTLSYYSNRGSVETAYSFAASSYVNYFYQYLYTESTRPVYSDSFIIQSDQVGGVVPTASSGVDGTVKLATSAVAVGSANAAGTQNATVANSDHVHQGVHSVAKQGSAQLFGDVDFAPSGGITINQTGNTIVIHAEQNTTPTLGEVLAAGNSASGNGINMDGGAIVNTSYQDFFLVTTPPTAPSASHTYLYAKADGKFYRYTAASAELVLETTVAASGSSGARGDVVLVPGAGVSITQVGQNITFTASASAGSVASIAASGNSGLTGAVVLVPGTNVTLSQAGQNITINASGGGGGGSQDSPYELTNVGLAASVAANAMTIRLKQKDGTTDPAVSAGAVNISFKNSTTTTGGYTQVSTTSAVSTVISSGSTAGSVNAQPNWVYVYAINNAGTVELAWSGSQKWDQGVLQSTTAEGGAGAADSKDVLYSTTARSNVAVRLIGRVKSTQATAGTWATAPSEISIFPFEQDFPRSEIWLYGPNGYGSTNNKIPRFTVVGRNIGPDMTYADTSADGPSILINTDGAYDIFYTDQLNLQEVIGVSINSTQLTTAVATINAADRFSAAETATSSDNATCGGATVLKAGDIVRPHTDGNVRTNTFGTHFRITKVSN